MKLRTYINVIVLDSSVKSSSHWALVQVLTVQVTCVSSSFYFMLCSSLGFIELYNFMQHPAWNIFELIAQVASLVSWWIYATFFPSLSRPLRSLRLMGDINIGSIFSECWSTLVINNFSFRAELWKSQLRYGFICRIGKLIWFADAFPLFISDYSFAREIIAQGYRWRSGWGSCRWHDQTDISKWTRCSVQSEEKICIEWDICKWFTGTVLFIVVIWIST